jgi:AbrB family looped-hinge helix DNA binding protein
MSTVTVSPKFQIVIPKAVREGLKIRPGAKLHAIVCEGRIELIPVVPVRRMRGFLKGLDTHVPRDPDRG